MYRDANAELSAKSDDVKKALEMERKEVDKLNRMLDEKQHGLETTMNLNPLLANKPVHDLEMSVRLGNILRDMGVVTIGKFMEMEREHFLRQDRAGVHSWKEVVELHNYLNGNSVEHDALVSLKCMAVAWNHAVDAMEQRGQLTAHDINLMMDNTGHITIYKAV